MLDLARVKNLGVIGHDREMREERRGVDPIERLEQVEKEPGLLAIPHLMVMVPVVRSSAPAR